MKPTILALLLLASAASGQWFEGFISLPDSLTGVQWPQQLAYDSSTNTVWVGGRYSDCLLAIQSDSNRVVARVRLPGDPVVSMCSAPASHMLYCTMSGVDSVLAVDCSLGTIAAYIPVQSPGLLFYSPRFSKMYCHSAVGVSIIDVGTNQLVRELGISTEGFEFCEDTQDGWIYCSGGAAQNIAIIDGATNGSAGFINIGYNWPRALCYSTRADRVYCANDYDDWYK